MSVKNKTALVIAACMQAAQAVIDKYNLPTHVETINAGFNWDSSKHSSLAVKEPTTYVYVPEYPVELDSIGGNLNHGWTYTWALGRECLGDAANVSTDMDAIYICQQKGGQGRAMVLKDKGRLWT